MQSVSRLWQIRSVIKRHKLGDLLDGLQLSGGARFFGKLFIGGTAHSSQPRGERIRQALEDLGPVFVKLGQALSTRPDLLPPDIANELAKLQDQVPPFPAELAMDAIRHAFGNQTDSIFAEIEPEPLASASIAQVHAARLQPGLSIPGRHGVCTDQVVVKVLRPNVHMQVEKDLQLMFAFAGLLNRFWSRAPQFKPLEVVREYEATIHGELDLRIEAANGTRMGANFEESDLIYVPRIYWDYTHENVLVMERIEGLSIREIDTFKERGYDLKSLAEDGVEVFFKQAFIDNFFHADMHAGNIFVSDQGKWVAIDFGIMGTLTNEDKRYLAEILLGFFNRDYAAVARAHFRAGWVSKEARIEEFEQAIRMVCEPVFAKPLSEISFGNVLVQLFQTVRRFEMPLQPQLVLLYKTLLNIEGLGRQLYPDLNLWDTAKPFLEQWMKEQYSLKTLLKDLQNEWPSWQKVIGKLPAIIDSIDRDASKPKDNNQHRRSNVPSAVLMTISLTGLTYFTAQNQAVWPAMMFALIGVVGLIGLIWRWRD